MIKTPAVQRGRSPRSLIHAWSTALSVRNSIGKACRVSCQKKGLSTLGLRANSSRAYSEWRFCATRSLNWSTLSERTFACFNSPSISPNCFVSSSRSLAMSAFSGGASLAGAGPSCFTRCSISLTRGSKFVDICAKRIRRDVERLSKTGERFSGGVLAVDGRFDRVERGLDRLERGGFGGLCPRGFLEAAAEARKDAGHGPKNGLPAQSKPTALDRHETVSPPWRKCRREPRSPHSSAPCADQLARQAPGRLDSLKTRV